VFNIIRKYLISATLVTCDHVSVVFDGGFVHAATTEIAVVRHRTTFGTIKNKKLKSITLYVKCTTCILNNITPIAYNVYIDTDHSRRNEDATGPI